MYYPLNTFDVCASVHVFICVHKSTFMDFYTSIVIESTKSAFKLIEVITHHQDKLCQILHHNEGVLLLLLMKLVEKGIIDDMTKNEVDRQKGYEGADTMMDYMKMKIQQIPELFRSILQVMREFVILEDVVDNMKQERSELLTNEPGTNLIII